jgi:hypothetical protein
MIGRPVQAAQCVAGLDRSHKGISDHCNKAKSTITSRS